MLIKEVEELLSMSSHTLRYYERMGLITPSRDSNGYRNYREEDIIRLKKIRYLRDLDIPIEDVVKIMNDNIDFQEVLEGHIKILETKIKSLQYVSEICNDLKEKEIPLLTALIDDRIVKDEKIDENKMKRGLKKVTEYFKPLRTVVIGVRTDSSSFLSVQPFLILAALIMGAGIGVGVPNMIKYVNDQGLLEPIKIFDSDMPTIMIISLISYLIVLLIFLYNNSLQRYIELTDNGIYICDYRRQGKISIILGSILNEARKRNQKYQWEDLSKVEIKISFEQAVMYRSGTRTVYIPTFKFYFVNGDIFEIESGKFFGEDPKTAYKILKDKKIDIFAQEFIKDYFEQDELSGYDYFEKIYHKNTKVHK